MIIVKGKPSDKNIPWKKLFLQAGLYDTITASASETAPEESGDSGPPDAGRCAVKPAHKMEALFYPFNSNTDSVFPVNDK